MSRRPVLCLSFLLAGGPLAQAVEEPPPAPFEYGVEHSSLIRGWDDNAFDRGRKAYENHCQSCHGRDYGFGVIPPKPPALSLARIQFERGSDPYSIFRTVARNHGGMTVPPELGVSEIYDIIFFVREAVLRPLRDGTYTEVDLSYLASLPRKSDLPRGAPGARSDDPGAAPDFGPALASHLDEVASALTVDLGEKVTLAYDLHQLSTAGAWTGGFLNLDNTAHLVPGATGAPKPGGEPLRWLQLWYWAFGGDFSEERADVPLRGPADPAGVLYRGCYHHGRRVVLAYRVDRREILESPAADRVGDLVRLRQTLTIAPGEQALRLCVGHFYQRGKKAKGVIPLDGSAATAAEGPAGGTVVMVGRADKETTVAEFLAAELTGETEGFTWEIDERNRIVLRIPPSDTARTVEVSRVAGATLETFETFRDAMAETTDRPGALSTLTRGGPSRWAGPVVTQGIVIEERGRPYVAETVLLPSDNPWNARLRTSDMAFFQDGRLAVCTLGGDVWIASGLDKKLAEINWRRYAAGLFEPTGIAVAGGKLVVSCRDRIVRLHDLNRDGEADFHESLHPRAEVPEKDEQPALGLAADDKGNLYLAQPGGGGGDETPAGGVVAVSADGLKARAMAWGLRLPNGIAVAPGGEIFTTDNPGFWVPMAKVNQVLPNAFFGYFNPGFDRTRAPSRFTPPIFWIPPQWAESAGGVLPVKDRRWGGFDDHLLVATPDTGLLLALALTDLGRGAQAGAFRVPVKLTPGVQRLAQNPADGQVYALGLTRWPEVDSAAPGDGRKGTLERVRHTGSAGYLAVDAQAKPGGVVLRFNFRLDRDIARNVDRYSAAQWNYRWRRSRDSTRYSVIRTNGVGEDEFDIDAVEVGPESKAVFLKMKDLRAADQVRVHYNLEAEDGELVEDDIYLTVHQLGR